MSENEKPVGRSVYYDAILTTLDNDIRPEIKSPRALHAYKYVRRQIARLAALNTYAALLPESLASLHPESVTAQDESLLGDALLSAVFEEGRLLDEIEAATDARINPRVNQSAETNTVLPDMITGESVQEKLLGLLERS